MSIAPPLSSPQVLHVEDSATDAEKVARMLRGNFAVTTVGTLAEGLVHLHTARPDVVLLDLHLPDAVDDEALPAMVAAARGTPVVVVTGTGDEERGLRALQQGAQDFLEKGAFDDKLLRRALRYAVERALLLARVEQAERQAAQARELRALAEVAQRMTSP